MRDLIEDFAMPDDRLAQRMFAEGGGLHQMLPGAARIIIVHRHLATNHILLASEFLGIELRAQGHVRQDLHVAAHLVTQAINPIHGPIERGVGIHVAAGPWLGYAFGGKTKVATTVGSSPEVISERKFTFDDEDDARRINYGLIGAAGIGFGKVTIDLRYNYGLNNILDNDADNSNDNRPVLQTRGVALSLNLRL